MYYFVSDIHLGSGTAEESRRRERLFCDWLERVSGDAEAVFIVGDLFDFWWEYRRVVPKGFVRTLGKLAELTDRGVEVHFFTGNHDMWQHDYLTRECGVEVHFDREVFTLSGKRVSIVHGDAICAQSIGGVTRIMDSLFRSRFSRWSFQHLVHPDAALRFGQRWSQGSRKSRLVVNEFAGTDDPMVRWVMSLPTNDADYYIFGHNHCAEDLYLPDGRRALFLGQWFSDPVYAALSPQGDLTLKPVE